jgi:hypothetical protein
MSCNSDLHKDNHCGIIFICEKNIYTLTNVVHTARSHHSTVCISVL